MESQVAFWAQGWGFAFGVADQGLVCRVKDSRF